MPRKANPDAIALLKADHRKVEDLFAKFEKARDDNRKKALAREICLELQLSERRIPDALLAAAAEGAGCDWIATFDEQFASPSVPSRLI